MTAGVTENNLRWERPVDLRVSSTREVDFDQGRYGRDLPEGDYARILPKFFY